MSNQIDWTSLERTIAQIRWHAELGANGFDHLEPEHAAFNAEASLRSICGVLDKYEDRERSDRIMKLVGLSMGSI